MTMMLLALWAATAQANDSVATARLQGALKSLEDSLTGVRGAANAFRLDLAQASTDLVRTRAANVRNHCAGAATAAARLDSLAIPSPLTAPLSTLRRDLARCGREMNPAAPADSLRGWGPSQLERLERSMRNYTAAAARYRPTPKGPPLGRVGR